MTKIEKRYIRLLRCVWLNPSSAEFQAAMHAFERAHPELIVSSTDEPLLDADELSEAMRNLDYFARCDKWERHTETEQEARELLGTWK